MKLYKWHKGFGRGGSLSGIFTAEDGDLDKAAGKEVCFGEVLGKHSEVFYTVDKADFRMVEASPEFVEQFDKLGLSSGYDPIYEALYAE